MLIIKTDSHGTQIGAFLVVLIVIQTVTIIKKSMLSSKNGFVIFPWAIALGSKGPVWTVTVLMWAFAVLVREVAVLT